MLGERFCLTEVELEVPAVKASPEREALVEEGVTVSSLVLLILRIQWVLSVIKFLSHLYNEYRISRYNIRASQLKRIT